MNPFISVIIPTRNRAALARQAVACVLSQSFADFEVLVMENSDLPELAPLASTDRRVRVIPSERILSMPDNWERALDHARGTYLMVISDKDMLLPFALAAIHDAIATLGSQIVTYQKSFWMNDDGMLYTPTLSGRLTLCPTTVELQDWFHAVRFLVRPPMIYTSAVHRDLIFTVREASGRFFWGNAPDIASSVVLLASTSSYARIERALAVSHLGPWSIGYAAKNGRQGSAARFASEFGVDPFESAGLVFGSPGAVAETLLACKRALPAIFVNHEINWANYVKNVVMELRDRERGGISTRVDREVLYRGVGKIYSRWALLQGLGRAFVAQPKTWIKHESPLRYLFPPHPRIQRIVAAYLKRLKIGRSGMPDGFRSGGFWHHKAADLQEAFVCVSQTQSL